MELIIRRFVDSYDNPVDKVLQYHEIETLPVEITGATYEKQSREIVFITGNKHKVAELCEKIKPKYARLSVHSLDLVEIQHSSSLRILQEKCLKAFEIINKDNHGQNKSVLIEDVCLNFNALNGMPGPYIKWFLESIGPMGLYRILNDFSDKSAEAVCVYAFMEDKSRMIFFRGSVRGQIVEPRGTSWGWDSIFEESRSKLTFAEMEPSVKSNFSHRANAITTLKKYLTTTKRL